MCEFALPPSTIAHFVALASARGRKKRDLCEISHIYAFIIIPLSAEKNSLVVGGGATSLNRRGEGGEGGYESLWRGKERDG